MRSQMTAEPLRLYCKYIMKKLTLLQATSNGVSRTIRANYYKQGGANALRNDGLIAPFVLEISYEIYLQRCRDKT